MDTQSLVATINTMQTGQAKLVGQSILGSNYTVVVNLVSEEHQLHAIYKPNQGERPLWDFPRYTLAKREVAAFVVSHLLSWNLVPPTVYRIHGLPYGAGSLQLFIPHNPEINFFNLPRKEHDILMKIALFDFLINNADRKGGHLIVDSNQKIWSIDHGLCFNEDYKLRSVIWDYSGEKIPEAMLEDMHFFIKALELNQVRLVRKLGLILTKSERNSLLKRGLHLVSTRRFPEPDKNRRSYPWPPI